MADDSPNTTQLEAVNTMLSTIGEAAVADLTGSLPADAAMAQGALLEISRTVQLEGWDFNTVERVEFPLDGGGEIPITGNVLRVDFPQHPTDDIKVGAKLYNKTEKTFIYTSTRTADEVVYFRQWGDLTEEARRYIMIRAARVFSQRAVGAGDLRAFTVQDELDARALIVKAQINSGNLNMLGLNETSLRPPRRFP